jgi:hypothetical protein
MSDAKPESPAHPKRTPRRGASPTQAWEERTALVKSKSESERVASDAKTARLRALRLAKEAAEPEDPSAKSLRPANACGALPEASHGPANAD